MLGRVSSAVGTAKLPAELFFALFGSSLQPTVETLEVEELPSQVFLRKLAQHEETPETCPAPASRSSICSFSLDYRKCISLLLADMENRHRSDGVSFLPERLRLVIDPSISREKFDADVAAYAEPIIAAQFNGLRRVTRSGPGGCDCCVSLATRFTIAHDAVAVSTCGYANAPICNDPANVLRPHPSVCGEVQGLICPRSMCDYVVDCVQIHMRRLLSQCAMEDDEWSCLTPTERWPMLEVFQLVEPPLVPHIISGRICFLCMQLNAYLTASSGCSLDMSGSNGEEEDDGDDDNDEESHDDASFDECPRLLPLTKKTAPRSRPLQTKGDASTAPTTASSQRKVGRPRGKAPREGRGEGIKPVIKKQSARRTGETELQRMEREGIELQARLDRERQEMKQMTCADWGRLAQTVSKRVKK
jgi:hypothetical protein